MKFEFRFQKVLDFCEIEASAKRREVSELQAKLSSLEAVIVQRTSAVLRILEDRTSEVSAWGDLEASAIEAEHVAIDAVERELPVVQKNLRERFEELGELMARQKALEALRDNQLSEYRMERSRRED